jgi:asparagine synthase (glutamine-hydrolysing)
MRDRQSQLFGWWGEENLAKKNHLSIANYRQIAGKNSENLAWSIYIDRGHHNTSDRVSPQIYLSASGISNDAWVKIRDDGNCLTLGREEFGKFPLYWLQRSGIIYFASHLHLLSPLLEDYAIDLAGLYSYSCFSYTATPFTPIEGIASVSAGEELSFTFERNPRKIAAPVINKLDRWQQVEPEINNEDHAIEELRKLLINATNNQITDLNNEPVGVFLSGGLDSSIVAALLVKTGVNVRAYSLDFGQYGISEYPYAEAVAHHLDIPLVKVDASPQRIKQALIPTIRALDLPFGDGATVPLYLLCQAASQEVKIIFNGEGGDQLFAGWTNKPLIAASIYQGEAEFTYQYLKTFHRLWGYEKLVFKAEIYNRVKDYCPTDWIDHAIESQYTRSILHRLRRATLMLKGAQNIHPRATNLGIACGLQVRSIFCDFPLAEFTFQLSGELTLKAACEKYILKKVAQDWLPADIVWRTKRGMGVPLTSWYLQPFWHDLGNWLNPAILEANGIWQPDIASKIVSGQLGGNIQGRRIGEILWLIMMWELWQRELTGNRGIKMSWHHPFWLPIGLRKVILNK